jgi:hypothetical protein
MMLRSIPSVFGLILITLVCGCKETDDAFTRGEPSLTVRAAGPCGINAAPTIPESEFSSGDYSATAQITITGTDANNPGDLLNPNARVVLVFEDESQSLVAGFRTTQGLEASSSPLAFSGRTAEDELFCLGAEEVWIRAVIEEYEVNRNGVTEKIRLESPRFPIRCLAPADYQAACDGIALPDVGVGPDMAVEMSDMLMADREPTWSLQFVPKAPEDLVIGIRDSGGGRPDRVVLKFTVVDVNSTADSGAGLEGVTVAFALPDVHPSDVEIEPASAVTNANGEVTVTLLAGGTPGVVNVNATATLESGESLSARTATVVIRGGIPSGRGFNFLCEYPVIPAFSRRLDTGEYLLGFSANDGTECSVQLADRVNGVVDLATQLFFLSEAGTIIQSAVTNEAGQAKTRLGVGPPAPFTVGSGSDGLVTLVAVTRGEEDFYDVDGDKIWDFGLDFQRPEMDLPEPYLDVNDNGNYDELDEGDLFVEEFRDTDGDGFWTPSNGLWDADIEIWQTTHVLWVGDYNFDSSTLEATCGANCSTQFAISPACDGQFADIFLGPGGSFSIDTVARDDNGNCLDGYGNGMYSTSVEGNLDILGDAEVDIDGNCFAYPDGLIETENKGANFGYVENSPPDETEAAISTVTIEVSYSRLNGSDETIQFALRVCR